jgi:hypothetical protein
MRKNKRQLNESVLMEYKINASPLSTGFWSADDVDKSVANIQDQDVISKLNAYLNQGVPRQYINPFTFLIRIQNKLAFAGLHFKWDTDRYGITDVYSIFPGSGSEDFGTAKISPIYFKLTQYGGPMGMYADGEVKKTDGISEKIPGGLLLAVHWSKFKGVWNLDAEIVRGDLKKETLSSGINSVNEGKNMYSDDEDVVRNVIKRKGIVGGIRGRFRDLMKKYRQRIAAGDAAAKAERQRLGLKETKKQVDFDMRKNWVYSKLGKPVGNVAFNQTKFKVGNKEKESKIIPLRKPNIPESRETGRKLLLGDKDKMQNPNKMR